MTTSVTEVTCENCQGKFHGHYDGLFDISAKYIASCPKCKKEVLFSKGAAFIDVKISRGSVKIMNIDKI